MNMPMTKLSVLLALASQSAVHAAASPLIWLPGQSSQVPYGTARVTASYKSYSPDTFIDASVVSIFKPLPAANGRHPPECDYLSYLRYRHRDGPVDSLQADRIVTFMPGTIAGGGSLGQVARSAILYAKENHGQYHEVWALDRRANCLEDLTGITAAVAQQDAGLAFKYYYYNQTINGRKFGGFLANNDPKLEFLAQQGVDQTSEDWYDLIVQEMPDQTFRTTKHYASGHSLGGPLTAYFANFDKDGNPNTTADAGYNQAAGFIGYDTVVRPSAPSAEGPFNKVLKGLIDGGFDLAQAGFKSGVLPRSLLTALPIVLNAEVANFLAILGANAQIKPKAEAPIKSYPINANLRSAGQFFFSQYITNFITSTPDAFKIRATNEALVGAILSDRSQGFGFLQVSVGFGTGGAIKERQFPVGNNGLNQLDGTPLAPAKSLIGGGSSPYPLGVPTDAGPFNAGNGPLYKWLNYDEIAIDGSNVAKANNGKPFANASVETTDIAELARTLSEAPLNFVEHYYPTRVTTDGIFYAQGSTKAIVKSIHPNGYQQRPILNIVGSEGLAVGGMFGNLGKNVVCPGYNHLDVLVAARKQNLGRPELSSLSTADFVSVLGEGLKA